MFARKCSQNIESLQEKNKQQEQIICEIKKARLKYGVEEIPIAYLIKTTKMGRRDLYRLLDMLQDEGRIEVKMFSTCPYCYQSNIQNSEDEKVRCSYCNEVYLGDDIVEKYRMNNNE